MKNWGAREKGGKDKEGGGAEEAGGGLLRRHARALPSGKKVNCFHKEIIHILEKWTHMYMISNQEKGLKGHDRLAHDVIGYNSENQSPRACFWRDLLDF